MKRILNKKGNTLLSVLSAVALLTSFTLSVSSIVSTRTINIQHDSELIDSRELGKDNILQAQADIENDYLNWDVSEFSIKTQEIADTYDLDIEEITEDYTTLDNIFVYELTYKNSVARKFVVSVVTEDVPTTMDDFLHMNLWSNKDLLINGGALLDNDQLLVNEDVILTDCVLEDPIINGSIPSITGGTSLYTDNIFEDNNNCSVKDLSEYKVNISFDNLFNAGDYTIETEQRSVGAPSIG